MILAHDGMKLDLAPSAYIAPNAVVCGDGRIGAGLRRCLEALSSQKGSPSRLERLAKQPSAARGARALERNEQPKSVMESITM
jgi:hypothetical protein